jgi:hypothetical protein
MTCEDKNILRLTSLFIFNCFKRREISQLSSGYLPSFIEQNQCPNVSQNNQREITLILKRDTRKSISAEVNKNNILRN